MENLASSIESGLTTASASLKRIKEHAIAGSYTDQEIARHGYRQLEKLGEMTREFVGQFTQKQLNRLDALKENAWGLIDAELV